MRIINHKIDDALGRSLVDVPINLFNKYQARSLCISSKEDLIQLNPTLKAGVGLILEHYKRVGLECSRNIIWDDEFNVLSRYRDFDFSVFFFSERVHRFRKDEKWLNAVKTLNSKNKFIKLCESLRVLTPRTVCFSDRKEFEFSSIIGLNFPVFVKIAESASGLGIVECRDKNELEKFINIIPDGVEFQIQEKILNVRKFINLQYIANGGPKRLIATEQILNDVQHCGNRYPIVGYREPWEIVDILADYVVKMGMKDIFAFDLAVTDEKVVAIECNPRFNGSSYPSIVARRLNIKKPWIAKNFNVTKNLEKLMLDIIDLEYDSRTQEGIIIINWGTISNGKANIMLVGNNLHLLEKKLKERL